jgi:mannose-6-phosphate isomerase-like protein (cupin superfamily)
VPAIWVHRELCHCQSRQTAIWNRQVNVETPTTTPDADPISPEDRGDWLQTRPSERCFIRVSAAETNGAYSVVEIVWSPGDGTPMHVHQNEDEHILVVEGTARIAGGDKTFDAAAGTTVTLTKNVPHAWGNPSNSPRRIVGTCTPRGVEEVLRSIALGRDIDMRALSEKFGVRLIGPMLHLRGEV